MIEDNRAAPIPEDQKFAILKEKYDHALAYHQQRVKSENYRNQKKQDKEEAKLRGMRSELDHRAVKLYGGNYYKMERKYEKCVDKHTERLAKNGYWRAKKAAQKEKELEQMREYLEATRYKLYPPSIRIKKREYVHACHKHESKDYGSWLIFPFEIHTPMTAINKEERKAAQLERMKEELKRMREELYGPKYTEKEEKYVEAVEKHNAKEYKKPEKGVKKQAKLEKKNTELKEMRVQVLRDTEHLRFIPVDEKAAFWRNVKNTVTLLGYFTGGE